MQVKLANILFNPDEVVGNQTDLLYHAHSVPGSEVVSYSHDAGVLSFSGSIDFTSYFNALSLAKWRQYTVAEDYYLHVELCGDDCDIVIQRVAADSSVTNDLPYNKYASAEWEAIDIPIAADDSVLVGVQLVSAGTTKLRNAFFFTRISDQDTAEYPHPVRLALSTTTFKKEDYIVPNIARVRTSIVQSGEAVAQGFHMFVVDNGQTIDAAALSGEGITVIPNCNAGGAGGFARGMIAAQEAEEAFTHIVLMDDDIRFTPESIKRLYALLSLVKLEYAQACVSGAMLEMENPALFYEDVSYMSSRGAWDQAKPPLQLDTLEGTVQCETASVEVPHAYAGWWFCCMPLSMVKEKGLPLPLFVRFDDVEYGLRCQTDYMTMAGICVWHGSWAGRHNPVVECYQYTRNILILLSLYDWASARTVMLRYWRLFHIFLRNLDYASAELWLDGLEDYLRGPDYLVSRDPFEAMLKALAKAEKFVPVEELTGADAHIVQQVAIKREWVQGEDTRSIVRKLLMTLPHDRHWFPSALLSSDPEIIAANAGMNFVPWQKTAMRSTLVAVSPDGEKVSVRRIDHGRYKRLMERYHALRKEYNERSEEVAQAYRSAMPNIITTEFWKNYLGL